MFVDSSPSGSGTKRTVYTVLFTNLPSRVQLPEQSTLFCLLIYRQEYSCVNSPIYLIQYEVNLLLAQKQREQLMLFRLLIYLFSSLLWLSFSVSQPLWLALI